MNRRNIAAISTFMLLMDFVVLTGFAPTEPIPDSVCRPLTLAGYKYQDFR